MLTAKFITINRGNAYNSLGLYQSAIKDFSKAIELEKLSDHPDKGIPFNNRGNMYELVGDISKAGLCAWRFLPP